jgi:hypothetical protein
MLLLLRRVVVGEGGRVMAAAGRRGLVLGEAAVGREGSRPISVGPQRFRIVVVRLVVRRRERKGRHRREAPDRVRPRRAFADS